MPKVDKHPAGSFCWIELATTDQEAAKKFYTQVFGWNVVDIPMGPASVYSLFQLEGRDAAAGYMLRPDQRAVGVPPHWMLYMAVKSADATAGKGAQLGGKVMVPAFDVADLGRMSVLQDPAGATFSVWQAKGSQGISITGVHGTLCWADLNTPDPDRAGQFYARLFGWKLMKSEKDSSGYLHIQNGEEFIGGVPPTSQHNPGTPPHWLPYFLVSDCDASAAKAKQLGASFHLSPMSMENVGRFAVLADPQGAVFAIFQPPPGR